LYKVVDRAQAKAPAQIKSWRAEIKLWVEQFTYSYETKFFTCITVIRFFG